MVRVNSRQNGTGMKLMINGIWRGDVEPSLALDPQRVIHAGLFRDRITADGSSGFPPEPGRYHLYASYACPFAHRAILGRALLGLEEAGRDERASSDLEHAPRLGVGDTDLSTQDGGGQGFTHLHQAYS